MKESQRPTHVYVGRKKCGCCIGVITDFEDKGTGKAVAEFIGDGLNVNRVDFEVYRNEVCKEEAFMSCPHKQQPALFPVGAL